MCVGCLRLLEGVRSELVSGICSSCSSSLQHKHFTLEDLGDELGL